MSISAISTSSAYQQVSSTSNQGTSRGSAMKSLADSINSGDLTSAKAAFDALQKNRPSSSTSASTTSATSGTSGTTGTSQRDQDMAAIGKALQSGDADAAKQALAKMQQDHKSAEASGKTHGKQAAHGAHHHHGHKAQSTSDSSSSGTSAQNSMMTYSPSASTTQTSTPGSTISVSV